MGNVKSTSNNVANPVQNNCCDNQKNNNDKENSKVQKLVDFWENQSSNKMTSCNNIEQNKVFKEKFQKTMAFWQDKCNND